MNSLNEPLYVFRVFDTEEHRDAFNRGEIFMHTADWYGKNEAGRGTPQGDENEGRLKLNTSETSIVSIASTVNFLGVTKFELKPNKLNTFPLLCMSYIPRNWKMNFGNYCLTTLSLDTERIKNMQNGFGKYVSLIKFDNFKETLKNFISENPNSGLAFNYVKYFNDRDLEEIKLKLLNETSTKQLNFLFSKGMNYFEEQEFRILFYNIPERENGILNINRHFNIVQEVNTVNDLINYLTKKAV